MLLLNSQYGKFQKDILEEWLLELEEVRDLVDLDIDIDQLMGVQPFHKEAPSLIDDFGICPFSILDSRQGNWIKRKKLLKEEIGDFGQARHGAVGMANNTVRDSSGKTIKLKQGGVSILDPVLAECMIKWFSIRGELLIDPFAGDTVFGYMAGKLGRAFKGIELRSEQVEFNNNRCKEFDCEYICDTGVNIAKHIKDPVGMVFSCPPYFNLEKYSANPLDASNMEYPDFLDVMQQAFSGAYSVLADNRFFVIVISDVRAGGNYLGMPEKIVAMLQDIGLHLYNRMILLEPLGTAPYRARRYFTNRKIAKVHQEVYVFYKGDSTKINTLFKEVEGVDFDSMDATEEGDNIEDYESENMD